MLYNSATLICYGMQSTDAMPHQTTYYSDDEKERVEEIADAQDKSFSKVVREAIQEQYDV